MAEGTTGDADVLKHWEARTSDDNLKFHAFYRAGNTCISFETLDPCVRSRVMSAFGSEDPDFVFPLMNQIARIGGRGKFPDPDAIKFALSVVRGLRPRDQIEAMLAAYMAVLNCSLMANFDRLRRGEIVESIEEIDSAERAINRHLRTFVNLNEAFDRHRNGTAQRKDSKRQKPRTRVAVNGHHAAAKIIDERAEVPPRSNGTDEQSYA